MKVEQQVVSLELAKQLKELGVRQDSHFCWFPDYANIQEKGRAVREFVNYLDQSAHLTKNGIMATGGEDYEVDFNYEVEQYLAERES